MTVSNLAYIVDAGITDTNAGLVLGFTAPLTGSSDGMTWTISGANGGHAVVETAGSAGFETINMTSTGSTANTLASLTQLNGTTLKTLYVFGSQDLTVSALPGTLWNVNALSFTGSLSIDASGSSLGMMIAGGSGNDTLLSGSAADVIQGGAGDDAINGGSGGDIVDGGAGNDTVTSGTSADVITGGSGSDTFAFAPGSSASSGDFVTDFVVGSDKLQFTGVADVASGQQAAVQAAVTALGANPPTSSVLSTMASNNTTNLGVAIAATQAGDTFVLFQTNGAGGFVTGSDVFIELSDVASGVTYANSVIP